MADKPVVFDDDNPEWTEGDFQVAQAAADVLPSDLTDALKRSPGRPKGSLTSRKELVSIRLDQDVLARFRASGPGWQSRINDALRSIAPPVEGDAI